VSRFSTINPPAVVSYFFPTVTFPLTNTWSDMSLTQARIRSAFEGAKRELFRYKLYPMRWDGYQAEPFTSEVLDDAGKILQYSEALFLESGVIPNLITTGPASDGSVDVEMRVGDRRLLMTLYPEDTNLRLLSFHEHEAHESIAPLGKQVMDSWLNWLYQSDPVSHDMDSDPSHPK
jgi:hypothetical protein